MPDTGRKQVSIVVPTYREAENLPELIERIGTAMGGADRHYEVVVVDDDSRDGTQEVIEQLSDRGHPVRLITRTEERGLSSAVMRGFREAEGRLLVCMDADLSHPPEALPRLLETLSEPGAEFVIGSRYAEGGETEEDWGLFRWLNSKVATLLARPFTSAKDPMAGFFALPREVFERADELNPVGYKIGLELIVKCGCTGASVREVPIRFADRKRGESKLTLKEQFNYLKHLKRLADHKFGGFSQFFQFCAVGGTGAVVDLSTYALLLALLIPPEGRESHRVLLGAARAAAILLAMTWNFGLNKLVTFSAWGRGSLLGQYGRFVLACSVGAVINWSTSMGLLAALPEFRFDELACAVAGIGAGMVFNFTLSRYWVFARLRAVQRPAGGKTGYGSREARVASGSEHPEPGRPRTEPGPAGKERGEAAHWKSLLSVTALCAFTALLAYASLMPVARESGLGATKARRIVNNLLHVPAYAVLALLWMATLAAWGSSPRSALAWSGLIAFAFGLLMEAAQDFIPGRGTSLMDAGLNAAGVVAAVASVYLLLHRGKPPEPTGSGGARER